MMNKFTKELTRKFVCLGKFVELNEQGLYTAGSRILVLNEDSFSLSKNIAQMIGDHKNLWCTTPYKMGENAAETGLIQHNLQHLKNATILAEVQPELAYNDPNVRGGNPARLWFDTIIYRQPPSDPDDFVDFLNNAKHMLSPGGEIHAFDRLKARHSYFNVEYVTQGSGMKFLDATRFPYGGQKGLNPYCIHAYCL